MSADIREVIGDDLYVSVSQLKTWMLCPRQFELKYVRGVDPEFVPKPLAFGTAFHSALARYYVDLRDIGVAPPVEKLIELFSDLWQQKKEGKVPLQGAGRRRGRRQDGPGRPRREDAPEVAPAGDTGRGRDGGGRRAALRDDDDRS